MRRTFSSELHCRFKLMTESSGIEKKGLVLGDIPTIFSCKVYNQVNCSSQQDLDPASVQWSWGKIWKKLRFFLYFVMSIAE